MYNIPYLQISQALDTHLVQDIAHAINGEYSAIACYAQLAELADTQEEKERISEIREDEIKHYRAFSNIYFQLTGKQPEPKITEKCPDNFKEGLKFAIKDEQKTVDFYLDLADRTRNRNIKRAFQRAAADEQNHAVWFLYYYTLQCCG
ncbi:ferritin family protein [Thermoactinomyces daqus]|uniref:ferritin family protein n=1 Tax=Thermoactinomyces TaxID=2023 RepID=UPI000AA61EA5|nr:ferritin family protein [Thermoactinomyces daqus]